jgi:periplasmic copper chaperone A
MANLLQNSRISFIIVSTIFLAYFSNAYALDSDISTTQNAISIKDAWVRPSHPGQDVGAAYMTLTSIQDITLVRVESDVSDSVEIHSMTMQNGVMKMRMLDNLSLVAGKPYKLEPGGFHFMLFDLKKTLAVGESVNFVLYFKAKNKTEFKQNIKALVRAEKEQQH